ncbi:MAG TPA: glycine zipper domain-containing protein [Niastella sp.]
MNRILYSTTAVVVSAAMLISSCKNDNKLETGSIPVAPATVSAKEYEEFKDWKQQQQQENTANASTAPKTTTVVHKHYTVNKTEPAVATTTKKKKGWSKAAKGTVIGAGAGAAAGAILVKKNRALGAVVGGVVGGGVGYGVGRSMDKKDGRVGQ